MTGDLIKTLRQKMIQKDNRDLTKKLNQKCEELQLKTKIFPSIMY